MLPARYDDDDEGLQKIPMFPCPWLKQMTTLIYCALRNLHVILVNIFDKVRCLRYYHFR